MEWTPGGTSDDIEDRRDDSGGDGSGSGGFGFGGGGFGGIHDKLLAALGARKL